MRLVSGSRIGNYEVVTQQGAGGMEVRIESGLPQGSDLSPR